MKNKKLLYILLPLTILIWGIIVYKIINSLNGSTHSLEKKVTNRLFEEKKQEQIPDSFQLLPAYRDPFLSGLKLAKPFSENNKIKLLEMPPPATPAPLPSNPVIQAVPVWPPVEYVGIIENKIKKNRVVILQVAGEDQLLQEGQIVAGVKLVRAYPDSIILEFNKVRRAFNKS